MGEVGEMMALEMMALEVMARDMMLWLRARRLSVHASVICPDCLFTRLDIVCDMVDLER